MNLQDKIILVTGATSGFGRETARRCAAEGARVIITGRRQDRLEELYQELGKNKALQFCFDIRDNAAIHTALNSLPTEWKAIDVLINNAGLALNNEPAQNVPLEQWEQMVDTNIKGLMYMTHAILPSMITRGRGHIINIGSMAGNYSYPGSNAYGGTKAFVKQFSLGLRADLLGTPIRVTNLEPGAAETEFALVRFSGDKEKAAAVYEGMQPLKAEDIAECIIWCLSLPEHVNVNRLEVMPVSQAPGGPVTYRKP